MSTKEEDAKPATLGTRFGVSLRIDEGWFEALRGAERDESGTDEDATA